MSKKIYSVLFIFMFFILLCGSQTYAEMSELRISGKDRFETAVQISKTGFTKSDKVVLSTAYNFPDALAGGSLAFKYDAPILLTSKDSLSDATKNEILRLKAKTAVILGSEGVVSQKVVDELKYIGVSVERIGGVDRFETAGLIAKKLNSTKTAIITYGYNFPDALAIAPYAAKNGYPILLVQKDSIPEATKKHLKNIDNTIIIGGTAIISKKVESQLPNPTRISGVDRFQTNAKIIETLQMDTFNAYVATGYHFADALTGSVLAAKNNAAMLLVHSNQLPAPIHYVLNEKKFSETIPLGGAAAVSDRVIQEMTNLVRNHTMDKAIPISEGTYTSHLISSSDKDYYKVKLDRPGNLTYKMNRTTTADWVVNVYTKDGKQVGSSEIETGEGEFSVDFGLPNGEFYVVVTDDVGSYDSYDDNERYTFSIGIDYANHYEQELNDSLETATPIPANAMVQGAIQEKSASDADFYKVTTSKAGNAQLEFNRDPNSDWVVYTFDSKGNRLGYSEVESGTGTYTIDFGLPKGDFYLAVYDDTGSYDTNDENDNYQFKVKFTASDRYEVELNDTFETATPIKTDGKPYLGTLQQRSSSTDADYFAFTLSKPGKVDISMDQTAEDDWTVYVYNEERELLGSTEVETGTEGRTLSFGLPEGTYYYKIIDDTGSYDTDDTFDPYSFSVSFTAGSNYEKEVNDKFYQATPVKVGQKYTGFIQSKSVIDNDYYEFNLSDEKVISVVMDQAEYDDWSYVIYNESLKIVGQDEIETGFSTYKKDYRLSPGKYFIKFMDDTGSYDYDDSFEPYTFELQSK